MSFSQVFIFCCCQSLKAFSALTLSVGHKEGHPVSKKTEWWDAGKVMCLGQGADLHMAQLMPHTHTHIHTHTFNGLFSRTIWVSQHQKGKPVWILMKQEMMGWQWHQLDHMQIICFMLQTDNHASTPSLNFLRVGCSS